MSTREVPGSGAVLRPNFNSEYGVSSIDVLNGGAGYASTDPPKIEISGTKVPLVEGLFYPVIVDGSIRRVAILNSGSGYFPTTEDLGTQVGIATTSYVESSLIVRKGPDTAPYLSVASTESSIIMQVEGGNGTSIFENGYNVAISTAIVGTSASITPDFSLNQNRFYGFFDPFPAYSTSGVGTGAKFNVFIVYNSSTGYPISTSLVLREGGRGYAVGDTVSISGTFMNGTSPTNDLSFTVQQADVNSLDQRFYKLTLKAVETASGNERVIYVDANWTAPLDLEVLPAYYADTSPAPTLNEVVIDSGNLP